MMTRKTFEDIKGDTRSHISNKHRQYTDQKKLRQSMINKTLNRKLQIVEKQLCIQINVTEYRRGKQNSNDNIMYNL